MIFLGFDPGGIKRFGWATLQIGANGTIVNVRAGVTSTAAHAVDSARDCAASVPAGIGIDAPLYWVQQGDRRADSYVRKRVVAAGGHSGTVSAVNSLQGACLVQGILVARLVGTLWPLAIVTEAHPKALLRLHPEAQTFVTENVSTEYEEHARDAALAAFSAWAAVAAKPTWHNLLVEEASPFFPSGTEVSYWFPR